MKRLNALILLIFSQPIFAGQGNYITFTNHTPLYIAISLVDYTCMNDIGSLNDTHIGPNAQSARFYFEHDGNIFGDCRSSSSIMDLNVYAGGTFDAVDRSNATWTIQFSTLITTIHYQGFGSIINFTDPNNFIQTQIDTSGDQNNINIDFPENIRNYLENKVCKEINGNIYVSCKLRT